MVLSPCTLTLISHKIKARLKNMTISEKIFALLEQKELSQKEFSEKTEISRVQSVTGNANGQIRLLTRY